MAILKLSLFSAEQALTAQNEANERLKEVEEVCEISQKQESESRPSTIEPVAGVPCEVEQSEQTECPPAEDDAIEVSESSSSGMSKHSTLRRICIFQG